MGVVVMVAGVGDHVGKLDQECCLDVFAVCPSVSFNIKPRYAVVHNDF